MSLTLHCVLLSMRSFLFFMFFLQFYVVCGSQEEKGVAINDAYGMVTTTPKVKIICHVRNNLCSKNNALISCEVS